MDTPRGQTRPAGNEVTRGAGASGASNGSSPKPAAASLDAAGRGQLDSGRVTVDGKFFAVAGERFEFRGVTYGTFAPRADGARFPDRTQLQRDLAHIRELGFSVVRTYTLPPDDLLQAAGEHGLRVLAGVFYPDWRYLLGRSRRQQRAVAREAAREVRAAAKRLAGREEVLALALGNEVPADVLRWYGTDLVAETLGRLVEIVRQEDPDQLVTYANYPTTEYLQLDTVDFLTFNVFLERREDLRRYLTRLHHLAGDRPLVLGEVGFSASEGADGEEHQAQVLDWQLETALERGVAGTCVFSWTDEWHVGDAAVTGWRFGLTRENRSTRPALRAAADWNQRTVRDLDFPWPRTSVVICAHNAEATIAECLRHTCALDYPGLEVIVVDDGSSDATAEIAASFAGVRLIRLAHSGLAAARNEGFGAANGELVAYLDADAYPTPEWPYYLALGLNAHDVGGVGGPNLPPTTDPIGAHVVARSPGGPVHVLTSDDRAEHVPGCNMAFWKIVLTEVGGFDPVYVAAGDDVDLCWRTLDRGWSIGFHPAAVVWHHRRPGLRPYLRQQAGYGRSEALVEARHPERFTPVGTARWRGRIYNSLTRPMSGQRIYRGIYGTAAYQSVYQAGGHFLDLLHQVGVPVASLLLLTAPLALISLWLAIPALAAFGGLIALTLADMALAQAPRRLRTGHVRFRAKVALHHVLQPLVRYWARARHRHVALRELSQSHELPPVVDQVRGGIVVVAQDRPRAELVSALLAALRHRGIRTMAPSGWESCDAQLVLSPWVRGELQTSSHPEGFVQVRVKARPRRRMLAIAAVVATATTIVSPVLAVVFVVPLASAVAGTRRARCLPAQVLGAEG